MRMIFIRKTLMNAPNEAGFFLAAGNHITDQQAAASWAAGACVLISSLRSCPTASTLNFNLTPPTAEDEEGPWALLHRGWRHLVGTLKGAVAGHAPLRTLRFRNCGSDWAQTKDLSRDLSSEMMGIVAAARDASLAARLAFLAGGSLRAGRHSYVGLLPAPLVRALLEEAAPLRPLFVEYVPTGP
jgi:hypothetical protein